MVSLKKYCGKNPINIQLNEKNNRVVDDQEFYSVSVKRKVFNLNRTRPKTEKETSGPKLQMLTVWMPRYQEFPISRGK